MSSSNRYSEAGKGSAPRRNTDHQLYGRNYDTIFSGGWLERKRQTERQAELKSAVDTAEQKSHNG